jgi:DNA transformation protein
MAKHGTPRGKLRSLRVSDGVRAFVLDQLSGVRALDARSMFGGVGLYGDGVFFGILAADVLYFKVDEVTRGAYEAKGMGPFKPYAGRAITMSYYAVPADVLEDADMLLRWARDAIAVARQAEGSDPDRRKAGLTPRSRT